MRHLHPHSQKNKQLSTSVLASAILKSLLTHTHPHIWYFNLDFLYISTPYRLAHHLPCSYIFLYVSILEASHCTQKEKINK